MKKRILPLIMAGCMALSGGCGGTQTTVSDVTESGTETAEGEGTPEIRETEDDAEAEPLADGEPAEEAGSPEETKENEPIG